MPLPVIGENLPASAESGLRTAAVPATALIVFGFFAKAFNAPLNNVLAPLNPALATFPTFAAAQAGPSAIRPKP